jgi:Rrf2 family protein
MWLTREADYGVQALVFLASVPDNSVTARPLIAEQLQIPNDFLAKILRKLSRAGIVRSFAGSRGGYALAKGLDEINVAIVIEAIDGPIAFARCTDKSEPPCRAFCGCLAREGMVRVQNEIKHVLAKYSLADLLPAHRTGSHQPFVASPAGAEERA